MKAGRKYLRASEIAALTGMSIRTVRRWIADEIIPSIKLGGARLVATADLEVLFLSTAASLKSPCDDAIEYDDESEL